MSDHSDARVPSALGYIEDTGDNDIELTIVEAVSHQGTIVVFRGESATDDVWFGMDRRPAENIIAGMNAGESITVQIAPWQVITSSPLDHEDDPDRERHG